MPTNNPLQILKEATESGCRFISFLYHAKGDGGTARYTLNFGIDYDEAVRQDKAVLEGYTPSNADEAQVVSDLIQSFDERLTKGQSSSYTQPNTYAPIFKGVRLNLSTQKIHIHGMIQQKEQVVAPTKPKKKSFGPRATLRHKLGLKTDKFRDFIFDPNNIAGVKVNGDLIELHD